MLALLLNEVEVEVDVFEARAWGARKGGNGPLFIRFRRGAGWAASNCTNNPGKDILIPDIEGRRVSRRVVWSFQRVALCGGHASTCWV